MYHTRLSADSENNFRPSLQSPFGTCLIMGETSSRTISPLETMLLWNCAGFAAPLSWVVDAWFVVNSLFVPSIYKYWPWPFGLQLQPERRHSVPRKSMFASPSTFANLISVHTCNASMHTVDHFKAKERTTERTTSHTMAF